MLVKMRRVERMMEGGSERECEKWKKSEESRLSIIFVCCHNKIGHPLKPVPSPMF